MELVIAEKPSVAQSIAAVLGATQRKDGYLEGNDYLVSWCVGHLVELVQPESYEEAWKKWSYDNLPIIPQEWQHEVKSDTKAQYQILKKLMHDDRVDAVVCATDAGREGELIFRLTYNMAGCRKPMKRLWISSMEESAIRDGFHNLRPGSDYDNLYKSALCRQEADWLVGINGTRLFTVLYMLKLPVPEAEYENVVLKPSEYQKEMVQSLADRAEAVRDRKVEPHVDNMLKITNDGRKLALDQRLINDMLPDEDNSKSTTCVDKAFEIWEETKEQKSAQLIFCDLSTPKGDGTFNVYEDICNKLKEKGVPPEEIAFIHDANTEKRKAELFAKVRSGQVRFLLGSTAKMGAGTNVQDRLIALHHLDVPWRPSDIEQQEGRILRQGNMNDKVKIFRYVTEGTFDSYSWQLIENKQKFIGQIMTSKSPVRSCEDIDEAALSYAEVKALATGNPYIKEKMDLDIQVSKLKLLKANHTSQRYRLEDNIAKHYPMQITALKERLEGYRADIQTYAAHKPVDKDAFSMKIGNRTYTDKKEAGAALIDMCRSAKQPNMAVTIGEYQGFKMSVSFDSFFSKFTISLKGSLSHEVEIGADPLGNLQRLSNALEGMTGKMADVEQKLSNVEHQLETAKVEVTKPFAQEQELAEKLERLAELNALLNMDEKGDNALDMGDDEPEDENGEQSAQTQESEPNRAEDIQAVAEEPLKPVASFLMSERIAEHDKERMLADGSRGRVSVKEKLAEMKQKISDQKMPEKPETVKSKGKEESL